MSITTFPLQLQWAKDITSNVRHFAFTYEGNECFNFIPGQFIRFHFEHKNKILKRNYSIATISGKSQYIEMALSYFSDGAGSQYFFNMKPGQIVYASGPYGRLILVEEERPTQLVLVATGTGVSPYRAMLTELSKRLQEQPLKVILLHGVQTRKDALYKEDFLHFAANHNNFDFRLYYSREFLLELVPYEYNGYVQKAFSTMDLNPNNDFIYLCGNPRMVDEVAALVKALGFSTDRIRREKYVS